MDTTPVTAGVLEGLDRLALNTSPETQAAILALKADYAARTARESRLRSAREELDAAESALAAHGAPHEPMAIVDEGVLAEMDVRLEKLTKARAKFCDESNNAITS